jgi:polysaccharide chain length determinant protein (PEP-CTERM system associated)
MNTKRRTPGSVDDFVDLVLRRKWWLLIPAVVVSCLTVLVVHHLPRMYQSETMILVEPQKVPADFVKPTVSSDIASRLQAISEVILSRTRLAQIIQKYSLYPQEQKLTETQLVDRMRKDIDVTTIVDTNERDPKIGGFRITYTGPDPVLVQQVTRELASLFIQENVQTRAQQALGTKSFIDSEVQKATQQLQQDENELRNLKLQYMGSLPEQEGANLQELGQLQTMLQTNADATARAEQQKTYLTSLMQAVSQPVAAEAAPSPLATQLQQKEVELATAEKRYQPDYPDVVRLKTEVAALRTQIRSSAKGPVNKTANGATIVQMQGQIHQLDQEIAQRKKKQTEIEARIHSMQTRVERLPEVEEKLAGVQREYATAKANYVSLLQKQDAAAMAAAMEQQAEGEEFRLVDPANLPEVPVTPNVPKLDLFGVMGGLTLGGVLAFAVEMADSSVRNERDLEHYLGSAPLALIPELTDEEGRSTPRWRRWRRRTA